MTGASASSRVPEGNGPTEHGPATSQPRHAAAGDRHAAGSFGRDTREVRRARSLVRSSLTSWGLSHEIAALELAVSELVTNALLHGTGDIGVQLTASGDTVRLDVTDHGGGDDTPHVEQRDANVATGGWGLQLVEQLSDAWGTTSGPTETRVWLELETGPRGSAHGRR